jgi:hypothetical protein
MPSDVELIVSRTTVPDADEFSWHFYSSMIFSEGDFYQRQRRSAHAPARKLCDLYAISSDDLREELSYFYAPAAVVRQRLTIQGYTTDFCRRVWEAERRAHIKRWEKNSGESRTADLEKLKCLDFEDWLHLFKVEQQNSAHPFVGGRAGPWHFQSLLEDIDDVLIRIALLCDALGPAPVYMDMTELYADGTEHRSPRQIELDEHAEFEKIPTGKIIVLTEGKSDGLIISSALNAFYPEFADAYQFLDFDEFRLEGGASLLARMVKTLSGARMANRMLALFDNDAAGSEALASLKNVRFPPNVRLMLLPDTRLASRYPTLGPDGARTTNVNGSGASIELYLGRSSLSSGDGRLKPVRWMQWIERLERYQGSVQDKDGIARAFKAALADGRSPRQLRRAFPEMNLLLNQILTAFENNNPDLGYWVSETACDGPRELIA